MSPRVTQEHKMKTQNVILDAAEHLFSKKGYHNTSMDDIVEKSGMSKGAIYGYFNSKEDLFLSLQERYSKLSLKDLTSLLSNEKSAKAKLEKAAILVFGAMCDIPDEACRMEIEFQVASSRMKKMRSRLGAQQSSIIDFLSGILEEGISNGEFKADLDVNSVATILVSAIGGLSTLHVTTGIKLDWDEIRNMFIRVIMEGIIADN
ncbi:MAG: TetR/AcrR family transcriptional regulator [Candidatus Thorarchaeota archaeon]